MKSPYFFVISVLLALSACNFLQPPEPQPPEPQPPKPQAHVTITASRESGVAPLAVTFTAAATPAAEVFGWTVGGERQTETSATLARTFDTPGLYAVGVTANGATDTLAVSVTDTTDPVPAPDELRLTQTPGGPAPWAVRYTVTADAPLDPQILGLEARCAPDRAYRQLRSSSFACVHEAADTVMVRFMGADGEVTARAEATPDIAENGGVAFAGRWRYSSRGVTETFEIVSGDETAGESDDGRFKLFTLLQREGLIVEFTVDGRTVVLTPTPGDEGQQRYQDAVYGLTLEPLPDDEPPAEEND